MLFGLACSAWSASCSIATISQHTGCRPTAPSRAGAGSIGRRRGQRGRRRRMRRLPQGGCGARRCCRDQRCVLLDPSCADGLQRARHRLSLRPWPGDAHRGAGGDRRGCPTRTADPGWRHSGGHVSGEAAHNDGIPSAVLPGESRRCWRAFPPAAYRLLSHRVQTTRSPVLAATAHCWSRLAEGLKDSELDACSQLASNTLLVDSLNSRPALNLLPTPCRWTRWSLTRPAP